MKIIWNKVLLYQPAETLSVATKVEIVNNNIKLLLFTFLATVPPICENIFLNMFQNGSVSIS